MGEQASNPLVRPRYPSLPVAVAVGTGEGAAAAAGGITPAGARIGDGSGAKVASPKSERNKTVERRW